jgi:hypothetical protein
LKVVPFVFFFDDDTAGGTWNAVTSQVDTEIAASSTIGGD